MKKTLAIVGALLALLSSCNKADMPQESPAKEEQEIKVNMQVNRVDAFGGTKATVKTKWTVGDVVFVFFQGTDFPGYMELKYGEGGWTGTLKNGLKAEDLGSSGHMQAVFFPYGSHAVPALDGDKIVFKVGEEDLDYTGYYLMDMSNIENTYTFDGETLEGELEMAASDTFWVHFDVTGYDPAHKYVLYQANLRPVRFNYSPFSTHGESGGEFGTAISGYIDQTNGIVSFSGSMGLIFGDPEEKEWRFTILDETACIAYTRDAGKWTVGASTYIGLGNLTNSELWTATPYVDLGLPSGLKWATFNLGATKPDECGDYYAWGEIAPKTDYSWATYKWMQEGQSDWKHITKYTFEDGKKEGIWYEGDNFIGDGKKGLKECGNADDAAYAALGGKFRLPTGDEWAELVSSCTWTWKTTADGYARNGYLVTGPNNRTIFLPAAGIRFGTSLNLAGSDGGYWSSSLSEYSSDYARDVLFDSEGVGSSGDRRYYGFSVRPVSE